MLKDNIVIEVRELSKTFKIYDKPSDLLKAIITRRSYHREFQALKKVSFSVNKGEVVGVIGRNGAGKSTLLKILAGTLNATSGNIKINGNISAILELGTGFHPEYSGRENIYLGGMCLGMNRSEVESKIDEIIEFSDLRHVIDQPFKTYSSGMKARLTFSVAISVNPDIFIVDEALAAGDAVFVAKCFKKITEICKSGATVFFVTHSTELVRRLCNRCIYFKDGAILYDGDADTVSTRYDIDMLEISSQHIEQQQEKGTIANSGPAYIREVIIKNKDGKVTNGFFQHDKIIIDMAIDAECELDNPAIWIKFTRTDGLLVTSWLSHEPEYMNVGILKKGMNKITLQINDLLLGDGSFDLSFALFEKRKTKAESAFYTDPMTLWEKTHRIAVQRKGRTLSTCFDQPIQILTMAEPIMNIKDELKEIA